MAPQQTSIFYLDLLGSEIRIINTDGSDDATFVKIPVIEEATAKGSNPFRSLSSHLPDGIQYDAQRRRFYWTMMGMATSDANGHLMSCNEDGSDIRVLVPPGKTHTPKQLQYVAEQDWIYWCDREGGAIHRVRPDGQEFTTLYRSHSDPQVCRTDERCWPVGIAIDPARGLMYWTQKGGSKASLGRILRAPIDAIGSPASLSERTDVEVLFDHLPEPIDLELDTHAQTLYWTDRGDLPYGNSLNKADVSKPLQPSSQTPTHTYNPPECIIADHFHEAIGLAFETKPDGSKIFYVSDVLGTLWKVSEEQGKPARKEALFRDRGHLTGLCLVHPRG